MARKHKLNTLIKESMRQSAYVVVSSGVSFIFVITAIYDTEPIDRWLYASFSALWGVISVAQGYTLTRIVKHLTEFEYGARAVHELAMFQNGEFNWNVSRGN